MRWKWQTGAAQSLGTAKISVRNDTAPVWDEWVFTANVLRSQDHVGFVWCTMLNGNVVAQGERDSHARAVKAVQLAALTAVFLRTMPGDWRATA